MAAVLVAVTDDEHYGGEELVWMRAGEGNGNLVVQQGAGAAQSAAAEPVMVEVVMVPVGCEVGCSRTVWAAMVEDTVGAGMALACF